MKALLIPILLLPFLLQSQLPEKFPGAPPYRWQPDPKDSTRYYRHLLRRQRHDAFSKLRSTDYYRALEDTLLEVRHRSRNYTAFTIFGEGIGSTVDEYNHRLVNMGFSTLNSFTYRVGFGISNKKKRRMFDFNILTIGNAVAAKRNDEEIKSSVHNYLNFTWGYDLVDSRRLSIYPFGGFGWRKSQLRYKAPIEYAPGPAEISDAILRNRSLNLSVNRFSYIAGIAVDFIVPSPPERYALVAYFARVGINRSFRKEYYAINGQRYDTGMHLGTWSVTAGMKWGGRK